MPFSPFGYAHLKMIYNELLEGVEIKELKDKKRTNELEK